MKQKQGTEQYQNCHSRKNASHSRDAETPAKTMKTATRKQEQKHQLQKGRQQQGGTPAATVTSAKVASPATVKGCKLSSQFYTKKYFYRRSYTVKKC
jgi:hypothetical protein